MAARPRIRSRRSRSRERLRARASGWMSYLEAANALGFSGMSMSRQIRLLDTINVLTEAYSRHRSHGYSGGLRLPCHPSPWRPRALRAPFQEFLEQSLVFVVERAR